MFTSDQLEKAVALQEQSYALLKWVNQALREGRLRFGNLHGAMSVADAACEWLQRHEEQLPRHLRPAPHNLGALASMFASYLTSSFEVVGPRVASDCGCYCPFCRYVLHAPHLKARTPDGKAVARAKGLKLRYLSGLAEELELAYLDAELGRLLDLPNRDLQTAIAWATYGQELLRRQEFASQGEAVLVLWRQIAWWDGRPRPRFRLTIRAFLEAERRVCERLTHGLPPDPG